MKTIALLSLILSSCAMDVDSEEDISEIESAATVGSVMCTGSYIGRGTCTATPPDGWTGGAASWTISGFSNRVTSTGTYTASWSCSSGTSAKITALGIGYTTVRCKAL